MTEIFFYQAECGDAARIRFTGSDDKIHNVMVDAGYNRTFNSVLYNEIDKMVKAGETIDLWIVSHIHDDHIAGVISYIDAVEQSAFPDIVKSWFYNSPRLGIGNYASVQDSTSATMSIGQGDQLASYLRKIEKMPNCDIIVEDGEIDIYGLKIRVLSPSKSKLDALRKKYHPDSLMPFERMEDDEVSTIAARPKYDYDTKIDDFDLEKWDEDNSIENGSSIAVLTSYADENILWMADAHPTVVAKALKDLGYSIQNRLKCRWVKVTHHGSRGNNNNGLYDLIDCQNYLMSADGTNKHCLPNKDCIARILRNRYRNLDKKYNFHFTYDNDILRGIFTSDGQDVFERWNFNAHFLSNGKWVLG